MQVKLSQDKTTLTTTRKHLSTRHSTRVSKLYKAKNFSSETSLKFYAALKAC